MTTQRLVLHTKYAKTLSRSVAFDEDENDDALTHLLASTICTNKIFATNCCLYN